MPTVIGLLLQRLSEVTNATAHFLNNARAIVKHKCYLLLICVHAIVSQLNCKFLEGKPSFNQKRLRVFHTKLY